VSSASIALRAEFFTASAVLVLGCDFLKERSTTMIRRLARIALVAALMVGVVAMHSFGHRGHSDPTAEPAVVSHYAAQVGLESHTTGDGIRSHTAEVGLGSQVVNGAHGSHVGHDGHGAYGSHGGDSSLSDHGDDAEPGMNHEEDPLGALSMLGFMICGAVLLRVAFEVLRVVWPRLLASLAALPAAPAFRALSTRFAPPPPRLRPTALLLNRIAVLRI
jgi:hypothetical protein